MPDALVGSLAGKRLLVVEEALKDFVGHWYEYVKAVAELSTGSADSSATLMIPSTASPT